MRVSDLAESPYVVIGLIALAVVVAVVLGVATYVFALMR